VLVDSPAHEFPPRTFAILRELFIGRNCVSLSFGFDCFEVQEAQVFSLFPVLGGLFADVDRRPIRNNVGALQQASVSNSQGLPSGPRLFASDGSVTSPEA
jgi:hypothetical protein